jgi:hypothetical protein
LPYGDLHKWVVFGATAKGLSFADCGVGVCLTVAQNVLITAVSARAIRVAIV